MKKYLYTIVMTAMVLILGITPQDIYGSSAGTKAGGACGKLASELRDNQRKLWSEHVSWTRSFIVSDMAGLEDRDVVLGRLFKNQEDIGNSIKPYYGDEKGNQLTDLLREHIAIAGKVVDAAKTGNKEELDENNKLWYKNADDISEFLNSLNPDWSTNVVRDAFYRHLQLLTEQVVARMTKNWEEDIRAYDNGEEHMLMFADTISSGIINQFPNTCTNLMKKC